MSSLLSKFGLIIEHGKTDIFHFSRAHKAFNPPPLDLSPIGGPVLLPKDTWRYLGFIFDCKLTFRNYIDFYSNKAIFTIKCMKLLGNSTRDINPIQKQRLYRCCALSIMLYGFPLWYYNKAPVYYHLNILRKMQQRAALWISEAFWTSPTIRVKAIVGLLPIRLHLKKLFRRFLLWLSSLPSNHIIHSILSSNGLQEHKSHIASIDHLMAKQRMKLKSSLIDVDDKCNEIFLSFSFFNNKFITRKHLVDTFSDCFSFHPHTLNIQKHIEYLEEIAIRASSDLFWSIIVSNASIKNQVATSISHIHSFNKLIIKTLHKAINVTTAKAELFTIRCSINQAVADPCTKHIIVITNSLHIARKIFDLSTHSYQIHSAAISSELREFFSKDSTNCIEFWDCPSKQQWTLHQIVDKETKDIISILSFLCKSSWDFYRKFEYDSIFSQWKMTFQASDSRGSSFLDLLDDDLCPVKPSFSKGSPWLSQFGHLNLLCSYVTRAITNHAPISEYWLRFFLKENFTCPCGLYSIKTR